MPLVFGLWLCWGMLPGASFLQAATQVVWYETFESDDYGDRWHIEGGVWGVGKPTSGPGKAHPPGQRCAATVLAGNYPPSADAKLVRDEPFVVEAAELCPRLRFWHWNSNDPGDPCTVEIRVAGGTPQVISPVYSRASSAWTRATLDLGNFAGQSVTITFHFRSNSDSKVSSGWYVDDVEYVIGCPADLEIVNKPEGFEAGLGDWNVEWGQWEVGLHPSSRGPGRAYSGSRCAGTILDGDYDPYADARLISPEFTVRADAEYPRLRFWHWNQNATGDACLVEIRTAGGAWQVLSVVCGAASQVWTRATLDLRSDADQRVQIAFHLRANSDSAVGSGWYVDEVEMATGKPAMLGVEGFELGMGDWSVDCGQWQVGRHPANLGPGRALGGSQCAATMLNGNYDPNTDSRLISPPFEVPTASDYPRLRFWHWWSSNDLNDLGMVEVRPLGGPWQPLAPDSFYLWSSLVWTRATLDLRAYAGQIVQIGFRFQADSDSSTAPGWYIDNVELVRGKPDFDIINNPERFTGGLGDWIVDKGDWQVGAPKAGPGKAYSPSSCAGTVLEANYDPRIDTRLISPEFVVPPAAEFPRLRFWQWYATAHGDLGGSVEVRTTDGGSWVALSPMYYALNNRAWTRANLDLSAFAGKEVQLGFRFQANSDANVAPGWYVDDIEVATGEACFNLVNNPEGFEVGLGDWDVVPGNWQVGKPTNGPPAAFKGIRCAGTVLDGNYDASMNTRLVSPDFVVPCAEAAPRLRFAHWHQFGTGDGGLAEIRELPNGAWIRLGETYAGSSGGWLTGFAELTPYAGRLVQLAFRLQANSDTSVGTGWYVDEVRIQASFGNSPPDRQINEEELVSFLVSSTCLKAKFRLAPDAPAGASIDPDLGLFTWRPEECDGPGSFEVKYLLFDSLDDRCPLGAFTNRIEVLELNRPPMFSEVPPLAIRGGELVEFRAADHVYDPDCPAQKLTYTLEPGSPATASLSRNSGQLLWIPSLEECGRTHRLTIRVTDDGAPPRSATREVLAFPHVRFRPMRRIPGALELLAEGATPGTRYEVRSSPQVPEAAERWTKIESGVVPPGGVIAVRTPLGSEPAMFYQCLVLPPP